MEYVVAKPSEYLRKLMAEHLIGVGDLIVLAGISRPTVSRHVNGVVQPPLGARKKYAVAFGMAPEEFEAGWRKMPSPSSREESPLGVYGEMREIVVPEWDIDLRASHWSPVPCARLDCDDPDQRAVVNAGLFRLHIIGDCMEPEYRDGELVEFRVVSTENDPLVPGADYAVCRSDGTATFKRLIRVEPDQYVLGALNRKKYPSSIRVPRDEVVRMARVSGLVLPPPPIRAIPE